MSDESRVIADRVAVRVGSTRAQHRLEIGDVAVHLVAEIRLLLVMAEDLARLARSSSRTARRVKTPRSPLR